MKIYFTASISAKNKYLSNYLDIVTYLQSRDHTVIADHIFKNTELEINQASKEERLRFHAQLEQWIESSDCIIAETSFPSISVGYEISLALQMNKPILILYSAGDPPSLLAHHRSEKIMCEKYNKHNLAGLIKEFINFSKVQNDLRFTFSITPSIAIYLERVAKQESMPKSVYLRRLIEKRMQINEINTYS